ncbi:hypothetical protein [Cellulomonas soli]
MVVASPPAQVATALDGRVDDGAVHVEHATPAGEVLGEHLVGAGQLVPLARFGVRERLQRVEHEGEILRAPGQLGRAAVGDLEAEQHPVAVVGRPQQLRGGQVRRQGAGHADLGARQLGGVRVLLGGDGLDEHPAAVGELQHCGEPGAEAARGADLGGDLGAGEHLDLRPDVPREVAPVQALAAERGW